MDLIAEWAQRLYETTGLNLTVAYDPYDRGRFLWRDDLAGGLGTGEATFPV